MLMIIIAHGDPTIIHNNISYYIHLIRQVQYLYTKHGDFTIMSYNMSYPTDLIRQLLFLYITHTVMLMTIIAHRDPTITAIAVVELR